MDLYNLPQIENLTEDKTLSLFTDASVKQNQNGSYTVCAGCVAVNTADDGFKIIRNHAVNTVILEGTNNYGEISAILMGVCLAYHAKMTGQPYEKFNIYADSGISVKGLREWIFGWYHNRQGEILYGSSGNPVANQAIFKEAVDLIVEGWLPIDIFLTRGHMSQSKYQYAYEFFTRNNPNPLEEVNPHFDIETVCYYNAMVDRVTRECLGDTNKANANTFPLRSPLPVELNEKTIELYSKLIGT